MGAPSSECAPSPWAILAACVFWEAVRGRQTQKKKDRVNNSRLWIRAKLDEGEGGRGDQCEERCTDGMLASNLFQHGGSTG
jgi:hypothetical protein